MKIGPILKGIKTNFPGIYSVKGAGGTISARYCHSMWTRHLSIAHEYGLTTHPNVIAENGPGDSIGIGLAGSLSGSKKYCALDVVEHKTSKKNVEIFDELITLFINRENIPNKNEFPKSILA